MVYSINTCVYVYVHACKYPTLSYRKSRIHFCYDYYQHFQRNSLNNAPLGSWRSHWYLQDAHWRSLAELRNQCVRVEEDALFGSAFVCIYVLMNMYSVLSVLKCRIFMHICTEYIHTCQIDYRADPHVMKIWDCCIYAHKHSCIHLHMCILRIKLLISLCAGMWYWYIDIRTCTHKNQHMQIYNHASRLRQPTFAATQSLNNFLHTYICMSVCACLYHRVCRWYIYIRVCVFFFNMPTFIKKNKNPHALFLCGCMPYVFMCACTQERMFTSWLENIFLRMHAEVSSCKVTFNYVLHMAHQKQEYNASWRRAHVWWTHFGAKLALLYQRLV